MIYLTLFYEFFKIGLFTFGGGYAMIPLVKETVLKFGWLTESEFFDLIGICESTPGPIAINMATYVGSNEGGIFGSIVATLGVVLPSFIIILLIASLLKNLTKNRFFKGFMTGVKPVIVALILSTGVMLLLKSIGFVNIKEFSFDLKASITFLLLTGIYFGYKKIFNKKIGTILLIIISAVLGILINLL